MGRTDEIGCDWVGVGGTEVGGGGTAKIGVVSEEEVCGTDRIEV